MLKYESILESLLYYSPKFRQTVSSIEHPISQRLLSKEGENIEPDITFIDIDDDGLVKFSTMAKSITKIKKYYDDEIDLDLDVNFSVDKNDKIYRSDTLYGPDGPGIYIKNRNSIKVGKLINKILTNEFKDSEIETFVNILKSTLNRNKSRFEIYSGEDFLEAYKTSNYLYSDGSPLGNSCMNDCPKYLSLYKNNPDVCRVLVLKRMNKIVGRAIVWKLKEFSSSGPIKWGFEYFMDKVYFASEPIMYDFIDYAKENKWAHKTHNHYSFRDTITIGGHVINNCKMVVELKKGNYGKYPYMDTFSRYNMINGNLYNDDNSRQTGHILNSTSGGFTSKNYPKFPYIKKFIDFLKW